jgi:hypothetical protein
MRRKIGGDYMTPKKVKTVAVEKSDYKVGEKPCRV